MLSNSKHIILNKDDDIAASHYNAYIKQIKAKKRGRNAYILQDYMYELV